jgi:hypothetical protein
MARITDRQKAEMVRRYAARQTQARIGWDMGISTDTVRRHLRAAGVLRPPPPQKYAHGHGTSKLTEKQIDTAVRLYLQGQSLFKLGGLFDVDYETVQRAIVGRGVRLRPPSQWNERSPLPPCHARPEEN